MPIKPVGQQPTSNEAPPRNQKVYQAAQMYETQFLRQMVKAMRSTVTESELMPASMGEKIFREQLDEQYVDGWSERGGIGFADLIYNHIMDRYYTLHPRAMKPQGPLPMEQSKGAIKPFGEGSRIHIKPLEPGKPQAVTAPWSGEIKQITENEKSFGIIKHDNGLESQISYSGLSFKNTGRVEAGEKIGLKSAGPEDLLWYVKSAT